MDSSDWDESKHPRNNDGTFSGGMTSADANKKARDEKKSLGLSSTKDSAYRDVAKAINKENKIANQLKEVRAAYESKVNQSKENILNLEKSLSDTKARRAAADSERDRRSANIKALKAQLAAMKSRKR